MVDITKIDSFVRSSPNPAWLATRTGDCLYANPALERLTGLNPDQIDHADWRNFLLEEDRVAATTAWERSLATGTPYRTGVRMRGFDGTPATVELFAFGHKVSDETELWLFTGLHVNGAPQQPRPVEAQLQTTLTDIEDRKRAEQALQLMSYDLQESKAKLEEAQRITHVGYWEWDILTGRVNWSDETYRIFGLRPQERPMDLDTVREKIHPEDWQRGMEDALGSGDSFNAECRVFRPTGEVRIAHFQGDVKRDASGRPYHLFGTVQDITDRKRAEEALQQSQFYLAEGQRLAHMGSWAFNASGFDYWSSELFQVYGLDPRGKPPTIEEYLALIHPEDRAFMEQGIAKMLEDHLAFDFTKRIVRPDGEIRRVRCVGIPVTQGGTFQGFLGTGMDVTEQERLTEELRRSEYYLAEGQRLAHMGSWVFDPAGFFSFWSRELFQIYGLDPAKEAPSLQEYLARVHPQDREFMASLIQRVVAVADASGCDVTMRIVRPDGELRYVRCVGAPVVENGTLKSIVGTAIDVTDHELLTQELRRREAYLAEAQRLSHTGSFGWRPDTGEIVWSDETYRIFEYARSVTPTMDLIVQRVHPEDRADFQEVVNQASVTGTDFEHTYRLLLPDGRVKHFHALAHATQDESGNREFLGAGTDITSVKRAEEELRTSEAYLAEAQRLSQTGSWAWSPATDSGYYSEECYRVLGFEPHGPPPPLAAFIQRIHPDNQAYCREQVEKAIRDKVDFELDYRIVHPEKGVRDIHCVGHPVLDRSGNLVELVGTVIDITESKRAEGELRKSEEQWRDVFENNPTMYFMVDAEGIVRAINPFGAEQLGYNVNELVGQTIFKVFYEQDREAAQADVEVCLKQLCQSFSWELRAIRKNGSMLWVRETARAVPRENGPIVLIACEDITERKQAEQKLQEQEMELRQMLDLAPQLVGVFGPNRERLFANRTALDYHGLNLDEWRQMRRGSLTHPDDRERIKAYWDRALATGSGFQAEVRLLKHDGTYRWFLARYNPVRDDKGQIMRWYLAEIDIEERKQAEERLRHENIALREEISKAPMFEEIVGASPALQAVLSRISKVARAAATVLITGETGTGKELIARAIHRRSRSCSRPFVSVNCAAIPRDLIAAELFGHEKGAFTGASQRRLGKFELAAGGTIFLDEIGEVPAETQIALLRVLQEHEFERVGGNQAIRTDVRVIAATNRDLQSAIAAGTFRSDLFYRLNVFPIEVPPLRERKEDIAMLVEYFIDRFARQEGKKIKRVDKRTLELVQAYPWPGNIRELQNVIERSVVLCETEIFSVDESWLSRASSSFQAASPTLLRTPTLQEREIIEAALAKTKGRVSGPAGAAARLGIPSTTLESKIKSLKINKHHFKAS